MNIDKVTTMTRIGHFEKKNIISKIDPEGTKSLKLVPDLNITKEQLKDVRGRVYTIVVDGEIKKIGGSQDKGGIQGTIGWYLNGFNKGNSERTYCTWNFLHRAITAGKKVEIYALWSPMVSIKIPTMTSSIIKEIPVDYHSIESAFAKEYYDIEQSHPELNMQESGSKWFDTGLLDGYINKDGTIYDNYIK